MTTNTSSHIDATNALGRIHFEVFERGDKSYFVTCLKQCLDLTLRDSCVVRVMDCGYYQHLQAFLQAPSRERRDLAEPYQPRVLLPNRRIW